MIAIAVPTVETVLECTHHLGCSVLAIARASTARISARRRRARRDLFEQRLPHDAMHRRRGVTLMVEEVRRRIADRRWVLIEDRSAGAGACRVDDAVRRRVIHYLVEAAPQ